MGVVTQVVPNFYLVSIPGEVKFSTGKLKHLSCTHEDGISFSKLQLTLLCVRN